MTDWKTIWDSSTFATTAIKSNGLSKDGFLSVSRLHPLAEIDLALSREGSYSLQLEHHSSVSEKRFLISVSLHSLHPTPLNLDKIQEFSFAENASQKFDFQLPNSGLPMYYHLKVRMRFTGSKSNPFSTRACQCQVKLNHSSTSTTTLGSVFPTQQDEIFKASKLSEFDFFLSMQEGKDTVFTFDDKPLPTTMPAASEGNKSMMALKTCKGRIVEDLPVVAIHHQEQDDVVPTPALRDVILRGANVSNSSKCPVQWASHMPFNPEISFVGRPFPLGEADKHFNRLKQEGFNCIRFLITWEAIEHKGPGLYDEAYLDYVEAFVKCAGNFDVYVIVDCHQDVWSRFTGGSGAPLWTLELCGLNCRNLNDSLASFTHHHEQLGYKKHSYVQNYSRFACLHMFTLFFGGKEFAPTFFVPTNWQPGEPAELAGTDLGAVHVMDFMQDRYFRSMQLVFQRLGEFSHVVGFDPFNQPNPGFIGKDLNVKQAEGNLSPAQAMALSSGLCLGQRNKGMVSVWLEGRKDVWQEWGVWKKTSEMAFDVLRPQHFSINPKTFEPYRFFADFFLPFAERFQDSMLKVRPNWILFLEAPRGEEFCWRRPNTEHVVNASHWQESLVTMAAERERRLVPSGSTSMKPSLSKKRPLSKKTGKSAVLLLHSSKVLEDLRALAPNLPQFVSAFATEEGGEDALSRYYQLLDDFQVGSAQWNYTPLVKDHPQTPLLDGWNLERYSLMHSPPGRKNVRPYAVKVCGVRLHCKLDHGQFVFTYLPYQENRLFPNPLTATLVLLPYGHFEPAQTRIEIRNAKYIVQDCPAFLHRTLHIWWTPKDTIAAEPVEVIVSSLF